MWGGAILHHVTIHSNEGTCETLHYITIRCNEGWRNNLHHFTIHCNEGWRETLHYIRIQTWRAMRPCIIRNTFMKGGARLYFRQQYTHEARCEIPNHKTIHSSQRAPRDACLPRDAAKPIVMAAWLLHGCVLGRKPEHETLRRCVVPCKVASASNERRWKVPRVCGGCACSKFDDVFRAEL